MNASRPGVWNALGWTRSAGSGMHNRLPTTFTTNIHAVRTDCSYSLMPHSTTISLHAELQHYFCTHTHAELSLSTLYCCDIRLKLCAAEKPSLSSTLRQQQIAHKRLGLEQEPTFGVNRDVLSSRSYFFFLPQHSRNETAILVTYCLISGTKKVQLQ